MQRVRTSELTAEGGAPTVAAPTRLEVYEERVRLAMIVLSVVFLAIVLIETRVSGGPAVLP